MSRPHHRGAISSSSSTHRRVRYGSSTANRCPLQNGGRSLDADGSIRACFCAPPLASPPP
jgi:hypothetical protein